ncbi:MAG: 2-phospho-L-lactate guanylyltransferase [Candidatus Bathyarchaeia archaeon]
MNLVVIPVKNLKDSKSRLSAFISDEDRARLTLAMLLDELKVLEKTSVEKVALVSSDRRIKVLAHRYGLEFIDDKGLPLNDSLKLASLWALERGINTMIVIPVDIPSINPDDIEAVLDIIGLEHGSIAVIAPCRRFDGTNLLALKPFKKFDFRFGRNSYRQHMGEAALLGFEVYVYMSENISLDIDTIEDLLHLYRVIDRNSMTFSILENILKNSTFHS